KTRVEMLNEFLALEDQGERGMYMRMNGMGFIEVVPGFAGTYGDRENSSIIYVQMVDPSQEAAAAAVDLVVGPGPERERLRDIRIIQAQYGGHQLLEWALCFSHRTPRLSESPILDIDEVKNRMGIGAADEADAALIEQELDDLGIPREVVMISVSGQVRLDSGTSEAGSDVPAPALENDQPSLTPDEGVESGKRLSLIVFSILGLLGVGVSVIGGLFYLVRR
ncbi:MAG: hypothetical protein O3B84_06010, partial [Chloroflexi bacterium]|nr:hypothetical protein [Chloroflexota bacterium]